MKTLYLDIFSGISGDMFIGAMIDLGVDLKHLEAELAKLPIEGLHLHARRDVRGGIAGVKFDVHAGHHDHGHTHHHNQGHDHDDHGHSHTHTHTHAQDHGHAHEHGHADGAGHGHNHGHSHEQDHGHEHGHTHDHEHDHEHPHQHGHGHAHDEERGFKEIRHLIASSTLSEWVKTRAVSVFRRIGEAEAKVHGVSLDAVHFHEVGAWDSIADIIGCCVALEALGKPRVLAAPVVEGHGWVRCAHGRFPVPTAATLEILGARGVALTQGDEPGELVTPTGAAILAEFAESFGPMRQLSARRIGYGLGTRENKTRPNVLRAILGETEEPSAGSGFETDVVAVIETNLDDVSGEVLGDFVRTALEAGALDVFQIPLLMKKNRPGTLLTVLCDRADVDRFASLILTLTTAYGVRISESSRRKLRREVRSLTTPYGAVDVKLGWLGADLVQVSPEFESCRRLAESRGVAVRGIIDEVRALAAQAWASSAR